MYQVKQITDLDLKKQITITILNTLPEWFGIEQAIINYGNEAQKHPFFAVYDNQKAIGFISIKIHNQYTIEINCMAILKKYHRQKIGTQLINKVISFGIENNYEFITIKTLDQSKSNKAYNQTRLFYLSLGFKPLEVFLDLWDENNPCLFMTKLLNKRQEKMYEIISRDPYFLDIYKQIEKLEQKVLANHNLVHINNVVNTIEFLLKQLNYDGKIIEAAKIAGFLHDLGMINGKKDHEIKSCEIVENYFKNKNCYPNFYQEILLAIKNHRNGINTSGKTNEIAYLITNVLVLADKLDIKKKRLGIEGYEVIGLRQIQFIKDIKLQIKQSEFILLEITFLVDSDCDKTELENFYFIKKMFKAVNDFANCFNLQTKIFYNETLWRL